MHLADCVDFVIPASIMPQHPDTSLIERAVESCWEMFGEKLRPTIICDRPSKFYDAGDFARYDEFIDNLHAWGEVNVIVQPGFVGQVGAVQTWFRLMNPKPVIYYHHDDWEILEPKRIDVGGLVNLLSDDKKPVEMVKFHKRVIAEVDVPRRVDHIKKPTMEYGVPLIRCSGWGTSPHFASRRHYLERIVPKLDTNSDPHGRRGIENVVYEAYRKDQLDRGFDVAQKDWGVFIYGKFGDEPYINHLGIERLKRRRQNGEKFGARGSGFTFSK